MVEPVHPRTLCRSGSGQLNRTYTYIANVHMWEVSILAGSMWSPACTSSPHTSSMVALTARCQQQGAEWKALKHLYMSNDCVDMQGTNFHSWTDEQIKVDLLQPGYLL